MVRCSESEADTGKDHYIDEDIWREIRVKLSAKRQKTASFKTSIAARAVASPIIFEYCDCWSVNKYTWAFYQWMLFSFPIQFPPHMESWKVAPIIGVCRESWKLYESLPSFIQEIWRSDMACLTLANTFNSDVSLEPGSSPVCCYSLLLPSFPHLICLACQLQRYGGLLSTVNYHSKIAKERLGLLVTMCPQTICLL